MPSKASAKISMRLVPNQDPKKVAKEFTKYVQDDMTLLVIKVL